ncbi:acyl-CoA N-acyltransferase [Mycena epipterygia]|nr:acyl-CoA N-acyltransferase [Mycena epipterygia]
MPSRSLFPENYTPQDARDRRIVRAADIATVDFNIYAVTPESPPKFIGTTAIFDIDSGSKSCESGVLVDPEWFRGGVATEAMHRVLPYAFEEFKLHRVAFKTGTHNIRIRSWLEWAGATLEGRLGAW